MENNSTLLLPYRSLHLPINGLLINCKKENSDPMSPPKRRISISGRTCEIPNHDRKSIIKLLSTE